jgi:signal transduction histidine kinase
LGTISKTEKKTARTKTLRRFHDFLRSSQLRYAAAYILISFAALLLLNLYAPRTIRSLIFNSQRTAMTDKAQLMVSAFSSYESLDRETVAEVVQSVNDLHTTRLLVTDPNGRCLYDSQSTASAVGKLTLFPEVAEALAGSDVVYIRYERELFICKAAMPIMAYNRLIGALYLLENDRDQAALVSKLQKTIFWISVGLEAAIILFSLLFSALFSRRMRKVLLSVQKLHSGDYSVRLPEHGRDELARLGLAFNELAQRLNQSEEVRKQFVSNASHELKTPLASIKLLSDSILQNEM